MAIYLYGIAEAEKKLDLDHVGIASGRIYTIRYREIEAVVSQVPENYEVALEDASTYETVLRRVMEDGTIIPMSFGAATKDQAEIEKILKRGYVTFKHALDRMRGKLQVNVTVSWNEEVVLKKILREDGELNTLRKEIVRKYGDQNLRLELGRRVKKALDEKRREIVPAITTALQALSDDFEENRTKETDAILNASFLLERRREKDFYAKTDELEGKYTEEIRLVAVGPLPPYNFTRIEIKDVDFGAVEEARKTLGLGESSNISEIRRVFNHLAQSCHPDRHPNDQAVAEKFGRMRKAYDLLMEYCEHRPFSFKRSEVEDTMIVRERPS